MKCQNPECENIVVDPTRKYCSDRCRKRYWRRIHHDERRSTDRRHRSEPVRVVDNSWINSCIDPVTHKYTPKDYDAWKKKAGIVFTVEERLAELSTLQRHTVMDAVQAAQPQKEDEMSEKLKPGALEYSVWLENNKLRAERDALTKLLDELQEAEAHYRLMHDTSPIKLDIGRAWDLMKRAGNRARAALEALEVK